jgi:hypothetical protein
MRTSSVDLLIECDRCAEERFKRHGSGEICKRNKPVAPIDCKSADGTHRLSAIQQGEPFFCAEAHGPDPGGT